MKQLSKLILLTMLVIFASCQNESTEEQIADEQRGAIREIDGRVVGDGELDANLVFDPATQEVAVRDNDGLAVALLNSTTEDAGIAYIESLLPESVTVSTTSKPGTDAYFDVTIDDASGLLSGSNIPAWCIDVDLSLNNNETLDFDVYSSYGDLPEGRFEMPENFDKVNWLLNQSIIGEESPNGLGTYEFGHLQYAMWDLIDDETCGGNGCVFLTFPIGGWDDANDVALAEELRDLAIANGQGYVPSSGEQFAVVLVPEGKQSIIVTIEVPEQPCSDCIGKVDSITFNWDWHRSYRVQLVQRYENTCYGVLIYNDIVDAGEDFSVEGYNHDGSFGKWIYVYLNGCYYTKFRTDCNLNIGPGYKRGVIEVVEGTSTHGGELCEYENNYHCYW
jgi:hypothetical protein